jgi:hypothetical protein
MYMKSCWCLEKLWFDKFKVDKQQMTILCSFGNFQKKFERSKHKDTKNMYRRVSIVVLNQFLRVSRKFENNRYTPLAQVRILSWDFFPLYFFYSFYQILIRSWDVELHTKFQPHKIFFEGVIQYYPFLKTVWKFL